MIKNIDKNNSIFIKSDLDFVNLSRTAFLLYIFVPPKRVPYLDFIDYVGQQCESVNH